MWGGSFHSYADDTQTYIPFTPGVDELDVFSRLFECLNEVRIWMVQNFLKLSDDKTNFLTIGNKHFLSQIKCQNLTVGNCNVSAASTVQNIGAILCCSLSMEDDIKAKCMSAWWQLYQISKIKKFLTLEQLKCVTVSLVLSRLDQNMIILHNLPELLLAKLQRVQNSAARLP